MSYWENTVGVKSSHTWVKQTAIYSLSAVTPMAWQIQFDTSDWPPAPAPPSKPTGCRHLFVKAARCVFARLHSVKDRKCWMHSALSCAHNAHSRSLWRHGAATPSTGEGLPHVFLHPPPLFSLHSFFRDKVSDRLTESVCSAASCRCSWGPAELDRTGENVQRGDTFFTCDGGQTHMTRAAATKKKIAGRQNVRMHEVTHVQSKHTQEELQQHVLIKTSA